jgi:hypothetical protein
MVKTQVQIPDHLYEAAKRIAESRELSFAEVVRRGLEYVVSVYSLKNNTQSEWKPPKGRFLGKEDPFADPEWRVKINLSTGVSKLAETGASYEGKKGKTKKR